jgi:hypothetical protein
MNERIGKLAVEAGAYWDHGDWNMPSAVYFSERDLEKFAELIVQECITTMTNLEADVKQKFPWSKSEVISTSGHIQKLKEHFGVKE